VKQKTALLHKKRKMKTTTKNRIISTLVKRFLATLILGIGLTTSAYSQVFCQAAFTYTVGSNGHVSFTNTSTGTDSSTNYLWNFGNGIYSNLQSPGYTYAYNGTYFITMGIDSSNSGCSSYITDSIIITNGLNCTLSAAFTYTAGSNGTVNFTDASTGVDPGMIYSWTWSSTSNYANGSSAQQSPSFTFPYNGTYFVTIRVGDPAQICYKTQTQTIVITNTQPCQVSFTYTVGANGQVSFTNTSQGTVNYNWDFGDGTYSAQPSPTHTYNYNGGYYIHLNAPADTANSFCGGNAADSVTIINTQNAPTCSANFTYVSGSNGQVSFTNTSTGTVANPSYSWNFGDGNTSGLSSPSHTYTYNGNYNVIIYEMDSFMNNICSYSQVVTISNGLPDTLCNNSATFYMYKDTSQVGVWNVYLASSNNNFPVNAIWYWGDGTSSTGLTPSHTYANAGLYTICLYANFACGDSSYYCQNDSLYKSSYMISMHVFNAPTGIKNITNEVSSVKLYPNPFTDNLTINLNSLNGSAITYIISDMYGNQIMNEKVALNKGENKININAGGFSSGVYFVNIIDNTNKKMQTLKIVK